MEGYVYRLGLFIRWLEGRDVGYAEQVTAHHIRTYILSLQEEGKAAWTVHGQARSIKTWFRWLVAEEWLDRSPMLNVKMPRLPKHVLPALSAENINKLLAAADNQRDTALILFLLDSGMRADEVVKLDGRDIDLKTGSVTVRQGKGQKDRITFIGAKARKALIRYWRQVYKGYPRQQDPVWVSIGIRNKGERLTYEGLRMALRRVADKAGVEGASAHAFRRTFALWSMRAGMNIYTLARLMGHEDITVLKQYLALAESDLRTAHEAASPVDKLLR